jgi:RIO-like serine/threonine protein kinase
MFFGLLKFCRGTESIVIICGNYAFKYPVSKNEYSIQKSIPSNISPKIYYYFWKCCIMRAISGKTLENIILNNKLKEETFDNINLIIKNLVYNYSIFHDDLHGKNIIIDKNNHIWIIDYGDAYITNDFDNAYKYSLYQIERIKKKSYRKNKILLN